MMRRVETVQPDLNALPHHGLDDFQPLGIAHAAVIGAVRPALYGPPLERSVWVPLY